jgi:sec-independent protein translocase protein TatC
MAKKKKEKKSKSKTAKYFGAFGRAHKKAQVQLESSKPLLQHLNELRQRLFKGLFALLITTGVSFAYANQLIDLLASPIGGKEALISIEVTENIAIFMRVSILSGLVLGMPVLIYQLFRFILPGLKGRERLWVIIGVPFATLLFVSGILFTWYIMIPTSIPFLINFLDITTQVRPLNYFEFVTKLMFWIGISFEMPLIVMILSRFGLVTAKQLLGGWRYAFVGIALTAAAVTPTVDPVNMGLVMIPLAGLYLISVVLAAVVRRNK